MFEIIVFGFIGGLIAIIIIGVIEKASKNTSKRTARQKQDDELITTILPTIRE